MNLDNINSLDFVQLLIKQFGLNPIQKSEKSIWVKSPFRTNEKTESFHISKTYKYDIWFDHGNGLGGKIVDFYLHYLKTDLKGVLKYFNDNTFSFQQHNYGNQNLETFRSNISIIEVKEIFSYPLKNYLKDRNIKSNKAYTYLNEVIFKIGNSKTQYAIGFKNIDGNFELRNKIFKGCSGKNLSIITNNSDDYRVFIFEGFFDFLSFMELKNYPNFNFIVMNSTANLDRLITYLDKVNYHEIHLYLDSDKTADDCTDKLINIFREAIIDHRIEYKNHKDLNDFLVYQQV